MEAKRIDYRSAQLTCLLSILRKMQKVDRWKIYRITNNDPTTAKQLGEFSRCPVYVPANLERGNKFKISKKMDGARSGTRGWILKKCGNIDGRRSGKFRWKKWCSTRCFFLFVNFSIYTAYYIYIYIELDISDKNGEACPCCSSRME